MVVGGRVATFSAAKEEEEKIEDSSPPFSIFPADFKHPRAPIERGQSVSQRPVDFEPGGRPLPKIPPTTRYYYYRKKI